MKAMGIAVTVVLLASIVSFQLFAQGYSVMDTVYTPAGYPEGALTATIYMPSTSNGIGVVLAHWWRGTRQTPHAWCEAFASNGYVAMTIDYFDWNSVVSSRYPKPVRAYKTAVEFLRRNAGRFGISTGKIVGFGQSEGAIHWGQAITADNDDAFVGTDPLVADSVDAAVLLYGAYDNEHFLTSDVGYEQQVPKDFADYPNYLTTKGNCIANFLNIHCPVLLFHGSIDTWLQPEQSIVLRDSMAAHHMTVELISNTNWFHAFDLNYSDGSFDFTAQGQIARDTVLAWLRRQGLPLTSSVDEANMQVHQFTLYHNYPNPFNPSTFICFSLPYRSHVTLTVYNTLGQKVATLVNGEVEPGSHTVQFDGSGVASGVYFYRMQAGSFVDTKKLLLMR